MNRGIASVVLVIAGLTIFGGRATADAAVQQGWWWAGNQGAIPEVGINASQPPADVPSRGLLIEGGSGSTAGAADSNPIAFAAVVYQVPQGDAATTLTLEVASASATTPLVTLELCPLDNAGFNPEQGGPLSDAPTYTCSTNVTAQASSSGNSFVFNISNLSSVFASTGAVALAILPTTPTDRVVFDQPSSASLALRGSDGFVAASNPPPSTLAPTVPSSNPSSAGANGTQSTDMTPPGTAPNPQAVTLPTSESPAIAGGPRASINTQATSPPGSGVPTSSFASAAADPTDSAKPLAVVLIIVAFMLGAALWLATGRVAARAAGVKDHDGEMLTRPKFTEA